MLIEPNEIILRYLYKEGSVAVSENEEAGIEEKEVAELMPDEYCDPVVELWMI